MSIDENYLIAFLKLITTPRSGGHWTWYGVDRMLAVRGVLGHAIKGAETLRERGFIEIRQGDSPSQSSYYVITEAGLDFLKSQNDQVTSASEEGKNRISAKTGDFCPYAGKWAVQESPAAFLQEREFREGERFPQGTGLDGREGPVTWIVLRRDDGGPTREE